MPGDSSSSLDPVIARKRFGLWGGASAEELRRRVLGAGRPSGAPAPLITETWDVFVAHAGADTSAAQQLHQALSARGLRSFLDSASLQLGDDWDLALPKAQRRSAMTVVLVSSRTEAAFYEREEIAAAVALSRRDPASHRVVPVYLEPPGDDTYAIPYGLRIKHAIAIGPDLTLNQAAQRIAQLAGQTSTGPR